MVLQRALIGGNWKCNGTVETVKKMCDVLNGAGAIPATSEVVIAVPTLHLSACKFLLNEDIALAAQDVGFKKGFGAFTGEHSAEMLVDSRIKWTLTGHSERRVGFGYPVFNILRSVIVANVFQGETSEVVGVKTKNAVDAGMSVIACIGETVYHLANTDPSNTP